MRKYFGTLTQSPSGAILAGAQVRVKTTGGALAPIFSDGSGTVLGNPVTTDANGFYQFYIADGTYTLEFLRGGIQILPPLTDVEIYDLDELTASVAATAGDRDLARAYAVSDTDTAIPGAVSNTDRGAR